MLIGREVGGRVLGGWEKDGRVLGGKVLGGRVPSGRVADGRVTTATKEIVHGGQGVSLICNGDEIMEKNYKD